MPCTGFPGTQSTVFSLAPRCQRRPLALGRQADDFHWEEPNVRLAGGIGAQSPRRHQHSKASLLEAFFGAEKLVIGRSWCDSYAKCCLCFYSFLKISTIGRIYFRARFYFILFFPLSWDSLPHCCRNPSHPPALPHQLPWRCLLAGQGEKGRPPQQPQPEQG